MTSFIIKHSQFFFVENVPLIYCLMKMQSCHHLSNCLKKGGWWGGRKTSLWVCEKRKCVCVPVKWNLQCSHAICWRVKFLVIARNNLNFKEADLFYQNIIVSSLSIISTLYHSWICTTSTTILIATVFIHVFKDAGLFLTHV